jgi:hypothetical protein
VTILTITTLPCSLSSPFTPTHLSSPTIAKACQTE